MPTDFHCPSCNKFLRVPDDSAGKTVQCPDCQTTFSVPGPSQVPRAPLKPLPQFKENPFLSPQAGQHSPGASPFSQQPVRFVDEGRIRSRVLGPAICLMVVAAIAAVWAVVTGVILLSSDANAQQMPANEAMAFTATMGLILAVGIARSGLILFGGYRMMKLRNYSLAWTATIAVMIPASLCFTGCCLMIFAELPVGIWSAIVLSQSDVREAFNRPTLIDESF